VAAIALVGERRGWLAAARSWPGTSLNRPNATVGTPQRPLIAQTPMVSLPHRRTSLAATQVAGGGTIDDRYVMSWAELAGQGITRLRALAAPADGGLRSAP